MKSFAKSYENILNILAEANEIAADNEAIEAILHNVINPIAIMLETSYSSYISNVRHASGKLLNYGIKNNNHEAKSLAGKFLAAANDINANIAEFEKAESRAVNALANIRAEILSNN